MGRRINVEVANCRECPYVAVGKKWHDWDFWYFCSNIRTWLFSTTDRDQEIPETCLLEEITK